MDERRQKRQTDAWDDRIDSKVVTQLRARALGRLRMC
jgi:hypothetical protein